MAKSAGIGLEDKNVEKVHAPEKLPKEPTLWVCACEEEKGPHASIIMGSKGIVTSSFATKRRALIYLGVLSEQKLLSSKETENIRRQIAESPLQETSDSFRACSTCWIPLKHGHFVIDGEETCDRFSTRGAIVELRNLKEKAGFTDEDVARIEAQINAADLPESSDIDIYRMAKEELTRRQQEDMRSTLSMVSSMLEATIGRQANLENSSSFPFMGRMGDC